MLRLLNGLFAGCSGFVELRALPTRSRAFIALSELDRAVKFARQNIRRNLFFGVGTRNGRGGTKADLLELPAVWADVDFKDMPAAILGKALQQFPFKPSVIVLSGGGAHLYWTLKEPAEPSDIPAVEATNRRIAAVLGADANAVDAARILRLPGSINYKYEPARPVKIHRLSGYRYALSDFDVLPAAPEPLVPESSHDAPEKIKALMRCRFVRWCREHPADVSEPMWYALLTILSRVSPGGRRLAHEFSRGYPKYSRDETDAKLLHVLDGPGPHTCRQIAGVGFDCSGCRLDVRSPISLTYKKKCGADEEAEKTSARLVFF